MTTASVVEGEALDLTILDVAIEAVDRPFVNIGGTRSRRTSRR